MQRDNAAQWLASVAWLIAALTALLPPSLYYSLESKAQRSEMAASVEVQSLAIMRAINRYPENWRFRDNITSDLIAFGYKKTDADAAGRMTRIVVQDGELIIASGDMPPAPHVVERAVLFESGKAIGYLEQTDSLQPLLWMTLMLALGSSLLAVLVFFMLKWIPLRVIENAMRGARRPMRKSL
jgi:hypothetical protein